MTFEEICGKVLDIIISETNNKSISLEADLDLSSIQILKVLASFERTFLVEIEDEYVFSGMFSSPLKIGRYIYHSLQT